VPALPAQFILLNRLCFCLTGVESVLLFYSIGVQFVYDSGACPPPARPPAMPAQQSHDAKPMADGQSEAGGRI